VSNHISKPGYVNRASAGKGIRNKLEGFWYLITTLLILYLLTIHGQEVLDIDTDC
jgi:hypothetical protein